VHKIKNWFCSRR